MNLKTMLRRLLSRSSVQSSTEEQKGTKIQDPDPPPMLLLADRLGIDRKLAVCTLCELFCTFFLMYGGTSVSASKVVVNWNFNYASGIGWGLLLIFTLYLGFNVSGAHMNPAISFLHVVRGKLSLKRFFYYSVAQFVGSFFGSALTYVVYYDGINAFDGGKRQVYGPKGTADLFATYPQDYLSITGGVIDQVVTTAVLCLLMLSITDERNKIPKQAQPALLGLSLWFIVATWSQNCGAALNPARDFAPRLMTFCVGYGWEVFSYRNYQWFWVPIIAPMIGALLGGLTYKSFIGDYLGADYSEDAQEFGASLLPTHHHRHHLAKHDLVQPSPLELPSPLSFIKSCPNSPLANPKSQIFQQNIKDLPPPTFAA